MRVIAGKYRRTPLKTLEGTDITRPTRDMVKEALFSTIGFVEDKTFLDLFAGSGAIGIEALSRGARDVVFNDSNPKAVSIIKENLQKVKEERSVLNLDCRDCLRALKGRQFDFVYCDPPYAFDQQEQLFALLHEYDLLKEKAVVICEVEKNRELAEEMSDMFLYKERKYGINKLMYYQKKENIK